MYLLYKSNIRVHIQIKLFDCSYLIVNTIQTNVHVQIETRKQNRSTKI